MKIVYILIGKKGSGKSYIGKLIENKLGIKFLQVEPYFINSKEEYKSINVESFNKEWQMIEEFIDRFLNKNERIVFESLGTYRSFKVFLARLQKKYCVKLIKIETSDKLSLERTKKRDNTNHVPMTVELIKNINKIANREKYNYDLIINNENASDEEILNSFKELI